MFNVNDIKNGMTIKYEGVIYQVVEFQHVKPGKGSAFVKTKLKNLRAGTTQEITFNAGIKMEKADVRKNQLSYLYAAGDNYVFMDNNTYDQIELPSSLLKDEAKFLKEGMNVESMNIEGEVIGITLPEKVSYKVISAPDAVKGNTTSTAQKDITIETGYTLKAPLFIKEGDDVVITTRDGKYFGRG
ncbi:elongation factor P [Clostridium sp. CAG:1000]|jgi:elongation factor P|nr:elongation factor P [Clostridium sp.]CCX36037.1 elongation factor P [Clostridium sp. CAG:1000]